MKTTLSPLGEMAGESPSPILRGARAIAGAIQTSSLAPAGLSAGLGTPTAAGGIAAHVDDCGRVGSEAQLAQLLAVVRGVRGDLARLICGGLGDHDVAHAFGVGDPRHFASRRRGGEFGGERGAQQSIEREAVREPHRRGRAVLERGRRAGDTACPAKGKPLLHGFDFGLLARGVDISRDQALRSVRADRLDAEFGVVDGDVFQRERVHFADVDLLFPIGRVVGRMTMA